MKCMINSNVIRLIHCCQWQCNMNTHSRNANRIPLNVPLSPQKTCNFHGQNENHTLKPWSQSFKLGSIFDKCIRKRVKSTKTWQNWFQAYKFPVLTSPSGGIVGTHQPKKQSGTATDSFWWSPIAYICEWMVM